MLAIVLLSLGTQENGQSPSWLSNRRPRGGIVRALTSNVGKVGALVWSKRNHYTMLYDSYPDLEKPRRKGSEHGICRLLQARTT